MSRRRALVLGGLGAASLVAGAAGWLADDAPAGPALQPGQSGAELQQPPVLEGHAGRLEVALVAAPGTRLAGRDTRALGYNGTCPGPTLRIRPGDELALRLTNQLDEPTNLHTHGLRVSPRGNSDNPFVRIDPGESFDYLIRIPADHPTGTYWYHPHHHGTAADQLFAGLAGALLVDSGPELPVDADRVLLVTDTTLTAGGDVAPVSAMARMIGRQGELVLVNGQHQPTISASPGALQRWRIVNGCTSRVLPIRLAGHRLIQIARDGTFLPAPLPQDRVVLAPGNRADVLVQPGRAGHYPLICEVFDRGSMGSMGGMAGAGRGAGTSRPVTLASMVSAGRTLTPAPLPDVLPAEVRPTGGATTRRRTALQMGMGMGGMAFTVDGRTFDPERDDQLIELGTVEDWVVTNSSPLAHPFHLHVWPFTVLASSDGAPLAGTAQDVVLIPAAGWVRLRIAFTTHSGRSVYHCHILDHADAGMMASVNVRA